MPDLEPSAMYFIATGAAALIIGLLWMLIVAFRTGFIKQAFMPVLVILLGAVIALFVPVSSKMFPKPIQQTGVVEEKKDAQGNVEERLTLTGAKREEYTKLKAAKYAVIQWANPDVTDDDAAALADQTALREVDLTDSQVTDATLVKLTALKGLEGVRVGRTKVSVAGVEKLTETLPKLKVLDARGVTGARASAGLKKWVDGEKGRELMANK